MSTLCRFVIFRKVFKCSVCSVFKLFTRGVCIFFFYINKKLKYIFTFPFSDDSRSSFHTFGLLRSQRLQIYLLFILKGKQWLNLKHFLWGNTGGLYTAEDSNCFCQYKNFAHLGSWSCAIRLLFLHREVGMLESLPPLSALHVVVWLLAGSSHKEVPQESFYWLTRELDWCFS